MTLTPEEVVANAYLTAGDAKTESRGIVQITVISTTAEVQTYDDWVYLSQRILLDMPTPDDGTYYVPKKELKEHGLLGVLTDEYKRSVGVDEVFESLDDLFEESATVAIDTYDFSPDRFGKLARLKGQDRMTISFHDDAGFKYAKFKMGSIEGMMTLLEESNGGA